MSKLPHAKISIRPSQANTNARFEKAWALHKKQKRPEADKLYATILRQQPHHFQTLYYYGLFNFEQQAFVKAIALLTTAIHVMPSSAKSYYNRGLTYTELKQYTDALQDMNKAIELDDDYLQAYQFRANLYRLLDDDEQALHDYHIIIEKWPDNVNAYNDRGVVYRNKKRFKEALLDFEKTVQLQPEHALAYANIGIILFEFKQYKSALGCLNHAITLNPKLSSSYASRGMIAARMGNNELAAKDYEMAFALGGKDPQISFNAAMVHLAQGDYRKGWQLYEARWHITKSALSQDKRQYTQPQWKGDEPLTGKTIYLFCEQGFGDTLQFCRYIPLVAALAEKVIVEVQPALHRLITHQFGHLAQINQEKDPTPDFDLHCPLMSLPLAFQTQLDSIPFTSGYLQPEPSKQTRWQQRLGEKTKPRIGLVWTGNQTHANDFHRSIEPTILEQILRDDFQFICLQKMIRPADYPWMNAHPQVQFFCNELDDFSDTAALCHAMDLVISVDTSVAHLAAALGKPTWLLLSFTSEWRWMQERHDNAWYDSIHIYRQPKHDAWQDVTNNIKTDLQQWKENQQPSF
nr:tetratricopeptide repeat protein [uncultured Tolumonas sp.]